MKYKAFVNVLIAKMHEQETAEGKRVSIQNFAEYLEVSQPLLSIWLKGNTKPSEEKVRMLAEKLGYQIYDSLGMNRPNPLTQYITSNWDNVSNEDQDQILKIIAKHTKDPLPNGTETKSTPKA